MAAIEGIWYRKNLASNLLLPLSLLFGAVARRRRQRYLDAVARQTIWRPPVPVIVVGNISVGGTGKTPVVIALIEFLSALGYRPGVVTRGYGGKPGQLPLQVTSDTPVQHCGDEPLLVHLRTGCPVVIDPDRPRAARLLLQQTDCNLIISDDGLQHYALYRDIELAVVDGARGLGNRRYLPAGPLREAPSRLAEVDVVLINGGGQFVTAAVCHDFFLRPRHFVHLLSGTKIPVENFSREDSVHAVAGIGNPPRFFATLRKMGFELTAHAFGDHFHYSAGDLDFKDDKRVIMTEKDAVKCLGFAVDKQWSLAVDADLPAAFQEWLEQRLQSLH